MKQYFGYTRVSTAKQGEKGVSLQEQHDAILRYAERNGLAVVSWFEERVTAAKRGRPVFNQMLRLLRQAKASGVIIHKIDRSARNLKDWADLGEMIDHGVEVHFVNESLDLHSRGGRLSADIQAVVAADYIRNLKEETRKGFYGRIKQGLYPLPAPLGYLDRGKGRAKEPDPVKAPLVRKAFELYATGGYNLERLIDEMHRLGLRNCRGGKVTRTGFSTMLNNPFYTGLIHLRRTGETFQGAHPPLIPQSLFKRVQDILRGKTNTRTVKHGFLFRRLLACARCGYSLVGERQKGHAYYRCHGRSCPVTCVREETVDAAVRQALSLLSFSEEEKAYFRERLVSMKADWGKQQEDQSKALSLHLDQLQDRLNRLTDAFLDGVIDKALFEQRKTALLLERKGVEENLAAAKANTRSLPDRLAEFLELAGSALLGYEMGLAEEKRELLGIVTSNRQMDGKDLAVKLSIPFSEVANRLETMNGAPHRDIPRTLDDLFQRLVLWFSSNTPPGLPSASRIAES
jgi:DNA invertase Pin-like site-specific DNA recombinase